MPSLGSYNAMLFTPVLPRLPTCEVSPISRRPIHLRQLRLQCAKCSKEKSDRKIEKVRYGYSAPHEFAIVSLCCARLLSPGSNKFTFGSVTPYKLPNVKFISCKFSSRMRLNFGACRYGVSTRRKLINERVSSLS